MKKKKPETGQLSYVPVNEVTGEELPVRKKRRSSVRIKKEPYVEPKTPLQKELLAIYPNRKAFATAAEYGAFHALEKKFNPSTQKLEAMVWEQWIQKMIAWAKTMNSRAEKPIIDVFKVCSAISNRESWGVYWHANNKRVQKEMTSTVSDKTLEEAYKNQEVEW